MYNNHDRRNTKDIDLQSAIILLDFFIKGWKEKWEWMNVVIYRRLALHLFIEDAIYQ